MTNKIAVIGSNSFSGASFCKYMLEKEYEIVAISRSQQPVSALLPYLWVDSTKLQFHQLDLNTDFEKIVCLLDKLKVSHVFNFAAQSMVGQSWMYPEHWFMTNAVSTVKLHNHLRQVDYLDKYIHISTPEVYGSCSGFISEDHHYNPSTPYAVSRAAADMSLKTFFDVHQFPVVSTRAANVYGPGQPLYRIIPKTIMSILLGNKLPLHGGGHSERSFIHIDDVSNATALIAAQGEVGGIYHISTKHLVSIRNLVEMICENMNVEFEKICEVTDDRPGKDAAYMLNSEKLRQSLHWQDKINLETGIQQTIAWAKSNLDVLRHQNFEYIHKA